VIPVLPTVKRAVQYRGCAARLPGREKWFVAKKRDDFPEDVKRVIAGRAGYRCSDPECQKFTIGPTIDTTKTFNVGAACHITAAAKLGPRFDETLTPEQRKHPDNGIWMCRTHGDQIDDDPDRYPVDLLRAWKRDAEARILAILGKPAAIGGPAASVADLSPAARFGIDAKVELEDGTQIPFARPFSVKNEMQELLLLGLPTFVLRFLIAKRTGVSNIMLYGLEAVVYEHAEIPKYRPLMYAYPQTVFPYNIELAKPVEGRPHARPSMLCIPPGQTQAAPFAPLVIEDDVPAVVDVRFNVGEPGLYTFALDAVITSGVNRYTYRVFDSSRVLYV
jgi:hypothetical protein